MIAAFEALRSEFRSAGAEGISLALVGFAILFFIAEKNRINENKNKLVKYEIDRKSTRLNSSHMSESRMPSSA